eukprot:g40731.t1
MAVRAVACSSCRIWEIRKTSTVCGGYTCEKCIQLQLLTDCVRELELDALRIIRGAENIIDKSYNEVSVKGPDRVEFVKCVQENFLNHYVEGPTQEDATLDLLLGNE